MVAHRVPDGEVNRSLRRNWGQAIEQLRKGIDFAFLDYKRPDTGGAGTQNLTAQAAMT